jgi:hypothetical protein
MSRFLDRNSGVDGRLTDHIGNTEGYETSKQACEQTSDEESAC